MRIVGEWLLFDDAVTRPTLRAYVTGSDGNAVFGHFLVDPGADRSVFTAVLLAKLVCRRKHRLSLWN